MLNFEERSAIAEGSDTDRITSDLQAKVEETARINLVLQTKFDESNRINDKLNRIAEETSKKLSESMAFAEGLLPNHIRYATWIIKKKGVTTCNEHETAMIQLSERLKQGETITVADLKEIQPNW